MYSSRRLCPLCGGHKLHISWVMGTVMVSVTSAQMNLGEKGGNLPVSTARRRRRSSRGRRKGRARGRQPRCTRPDDALLLAEPSRPESGNRKGSRQTYLKRVASHRMHFMESRFKFLEKLEEASKLHEARLSGEMRVDDRDSPFQVRLDRMSVDLKQKRFPLPPPKGRDRGLRGLYRRWYWLKHGTWEYVSSDLKDGEWDWDFDRGLAGFPEKPAKISFVTKRRRNAPPIVCRACGYVGQGPHATFAQCVVNRTGEGNHAPSRATSSSNRTERKRAVRRCGCVRGAKCPH
jgi:hypothetical protein